ncbi:MAG TPA: hypothetical protein PLP44_05185 [Methylophilus sp.]|nr:hypothetical protein [Methylophilus sp.]
MSKSDEYLKAFLEIVDEASKSAKQKSDLGLNLIDDVAGRFDEFLVNQHFDLQIKKMTLKGILKAIFSLPRTLDFGPEPCPKVKQFIDYLEQNNLLKRNEIRLLNIYQMLRFEENGSCKILMPSRFDFKKANVLLAVTFLISVIAGFYVWHDAEILNKNFMVIYTIGTLLGYLFRGAYDLAWGRENLASYIKTRYPWFVLEQ